MGRPLSIHRLRPQRRIPWDGNHWEPLGVPIGNLAVGFKHLISLKTSYIWLRSLPWIMTTKIGGRVGHVGNSVVFWYCDYVYTHIVLLAWWTFQYCLEMFGEFSKNVLTWVNLNILGRGYTDLIVRNPCCGTRRTVRSHTDSKGLQGGPLWLVPACFLCWKGTGCCKSMAMTPSAARSEQSQGNRSACDAWEHVWS